MKATNSNLVVTDVSFSSYLKPSDQEASSQEHPNSIDAELGIFDARKYFNEGVAVSNEQTTLSSSKRVSPIKDGNLSHPSDPSFFPRFSSASSVDGYGPSYRNRSLASSEVSWNSHTGLLGPSSGPQRDKKRGGGSSRKNKVPRWLLFHSKCPCSGKNSVQVKENPKNTMKKEEASTHPGNPNLNREKTVAADQRNHFRVSLNMDSRHVLVSAPPKPLTTDAASVTVTATSGFTFPLLNATPPSSSLPPMKILHDPKVGANSTFFDVPIDDGEATKMNGSTITVDVEPDDAASDTSSDLFEIESITTQSIHPVPTHHHRHRDSLDEAIPRVLPSNCVVVDGKKLLMAGKHPSEASNVHRIMTTVPEGSNFGPKIGTDYHSHLSAPEFERFPRIDLGRSARVIMGSAECDGNSRLRENGLLSCRS